MNSELPLRISKLVTTGTVGVVIVIAFLPPALAVEPPHWTSPSFTIDCSTQCHSLHASPGVGLTQNASNVNLCQSCHSPGNSAKNAPILRLPFGLT